MVRANYTNLKKGIHETTYYLELFLRNLLLNETNELHHRSMHISGYFDKQNHQELVLPDTLSSKTKKNILSLYNTFSNVIVFGRSDILEVLSMSSSSASNLIKKMLELNMIYSVKGFGKGKYRFY